MAERPDLGIETPSPMTTAAPERGGAHLVPHVCRLEHSQRFQVAATAGPSHYGAVGQRGPPTLAA